MLTLEAETPFSLTVNIVKEFSSDYENLFYFVSFHFQVVVWEFPVDELNFSYKIFKHTCIKMSGYF